MSNFRHTTEESLRRWEANADYWDDKMGDGSNVFHTTIVRPDTERLLAVQQGEVVLDIACGNGNFSQRLAEMGATVVAFDYSETLIEHARTRRAAFLNAITFHVCDATNAEQLLNLKPDTLFDKAVANMAIMDISDIAPLLNAVYAMLKPQGIFVFSTHHPCFMRPQHTYMTPCVYEGVAITGQPALQFYYHRPLSALLTECFSVGFVLDGFCENVDDDPETPVIITVRVVKSVK